MTEKLIPVQLFGTPIADAKVGVYIAPGADVSTASSGWTFTDITTDVLFKNLVTLSLGRSDEQSQAQTASCSFTVLNDTGNYTPRRPAGAYYPNMRVGFPVKVEVVSASTGTVQLFTGYVDELAPSWDASMSVPTVNVTAKGTIQRLQQGNQPLRTAVETIAYDATLINTVASYWPLTDGETSSQAGSGLSNGAALKVSGGTMDFAAFDGFPGSDPIAEFGAGANLHGDIDNSRADTTGAVFFRCMLHVGSALTDTTTMMQWLFTGGTVSRAEIRYRTAGGVQLRVFDQSGGTLYDSGAVAFGIDANDLFIAMEFTQNGANIDVLLYIAKLGTFLAGTNSTTILTQTIGRLRHYDVGGSGTMTGWGIGHVGVSNDIDWMFNSFQILEAYESETVQDRIERVCDEAGVPVTIVGGASTNMDSQPKGTLIDVLRDCEATDHGVLYDGLGFGVVYVCRAALENSAVDLALSIADRDVMPPFEPLENTRLTVNDVTVRRSGGGSGRLTQDDGPYATQDVGVFASEYTVNVPNDYEVLNHAGWLLHLGTVDVDRFSSLNLDFTASPRIARTWLSSIGIGSRVTVTGLPTNGGTDPDLFVEGYSMTIGPKDWNVSVNCSPSVAYGVGELASSSGDTDEFLARIDPVSSTVETTAAQGTTSLRLSAGQLWTTRADDFPLNLDLLGYKVPVSSIVGPWTFVSFGTGAAADAAAISPGLPTGWQQGDLLLTFHATRDTTYASLPQTPAGYTSLFTSANMKICGKYATSSESAPSLTYSGGAGDTCLGIMAAVRPSTTVSGFSTGTATQLNGSLQDVAYPALGSSAMNEVKMIFGWKADDSTAVSIAQPWYQNVTSVSSVLGNDATIIVGIDCFKFPYPLSANDIVITGGAANVSRTIVGAVRSTTDPVQVATTGGLPATMAAGTPVELWLPAVLGV